MSGCNWGRNLAIAALILISAPAAASSGQVALKPAAPSPETQPAPQSSAQIELLETHVRFEADGSSRREVHARVRILSEAGVAEFGRLAFDYNRSFEKIDIPLVRITHPSGGTADILSGAISDEPNPAVLSAPAYQDVRRKSVRILGLEPRDLLEYRVISTVSHHPLAPDFWLDHSFDRSGVVSQETYEIDLPASRPAQIRINPAIPPTSIEKSGEGSDARILYRWQRSASKEQSPAAEDSSRKSDGADPDVALSTFGAWDELSIKLDQRLTPGAVPQEKILEDKESLKELRDKPEVARDIKAKADELTKSARTNRERLQSIYDFVSQKIATIDLPLGSTGFMARPTAEILSSGYATPEDKFALFAALSSAVKLTARGALTGYCDKKGLARPSVFNHLLVYAFDGTAGSWLDPSLEVAPFGMISSIPQKCVFVLNRPLLVMNSTRHEWQPLRRKLPFAARQKVEVNASLALDGKLTARVHYAVRGENELLLRLAFHHTPKEKWKEVAQLLSLSDGFRGQVASATASDPYATREPFIIEYELSQPDFVDWKKEPVLIPALLPQLGLPDLPSKSAGKTTASPIDLGTPLDVLTHATLRLPPGTKAHAPAASSVSRDYATYSSTYSMQGASVTASRHLKFILRELPASRAADYSAFVRAVQSDEAQEFSLERAAAPPAKSRAPKKAAPPSRNN